MQMSVGLAVTYTFYPSCLFSVLYKELTGTGAPPVGLPLGTVHILTLESEFTDVTRKCMYVHVCIHV